MESAAHEQQKAKTTRILPVVLLPLMRSPAQFWMLEYIEGSAKSFSSELEEDCSMRDLDKQRRQRIREFAGIC